ncbi:MAG: glucose-1-phosphate adenylyltransferase [Betaproteobacteria bacterium RIFCSPLOWO2_12_FULL_65_14]|nr:MAG: glucose-1-phosphate adenylyltransferase [Betaproteobacteria bacterium RIFCSPLOWO2_12_FULL_65_14]
MSEVPDHFPADHARAERRPSDARRPSELVRHTLAIILAGGRGTRLDRLTEWRAKPAVPFGGKFRIIDFTLSNCVNSGVRHVGIATQYRGQSLIRHVQLGWSFLDGRFGEFIELLPAQQSGGHDWYKGTADAVYQNLDLFSRVNPEHVLVLAGDHVYKMDYSKMLEEHVAKRARITVACIDVPVDAARSLGVVGVDHTGRIEAFVEKPAQPPTIPGRPDRSLGSMGIYAFDGQFLRAELIRDAHDPRSGHDFGKDIIPRLVKEGAPAYAHFFTGSSVNMVEGVPYWRDVGTVDAYWEANLDLTRVVPDLNLYDDEWPIWTWQEQRPPAKFVFDLDGRRGEAIDSLVSGGCIVSGSSVRRSLLFTNVRVHSYASIEDSVLLPDVDVGRHCVIRRAVIDSQCRLAEGFTVGVNPEEDRKRFHVTERGVALIVPEMIGQQAHYPR